MSNLHKDPWMMQRIAQTLDAIEAGRVEKREVELDLIAFAEDVLERFGPVEGPEVPECKCDSGPHVCGLPEYLKSLEEPVEKPKPKDKEHDKYCELPMGFPDARCTCEPKW